MKIIKLLLINCVVAGALCLPMEVRKPLKPIFDVSGHQLPPQPINTSYEPLNGLERVPTDCKDFINKYDWDVKIAYAVMMAESKGNSNARGDVHLTFEQDGVRYGDSWGCMQVRYLPGRPTPEQLLDPGFNIEYAYGLYKKNGWQPWTMFNNSAYLRFMN